MTLGLLVASAVATGCGDTVPGASSDAGGAAGEGGNDAGAQAAQGGSSTAAGAQSGASTGGARGGGNNTGNSGVAGQAATGGTGGVGAAGAAMTAGTGGVGAAGAAMTAGTGGVGAAGGAAGDGGAAELVGGAGAAGGSDNGSQALTSVVVSDPGVAFASTPTLSYLSEVLSVTDAGGGRGAWQARSDAAWLSVTSAGSGNDKLRLTANPAGLAKNTLHYATVSVSSQSAGDGDVVRVGFWVGASSPQAVKTWPVDATHVYTDPIRPYAYVAMGDGFVVYNVYTGEKETTHAVAAQLGEAAISTDGSTLFVVDEATHEILPISLDNWQQGARWALDDTYSFAPTLAYVRTRGLGVVLSTDGFAYRASDGAALSDGVELAPAGYGSLASSLAGNRYCWLNSGYSPFSLACHTLELEPQTGNLLVGKAVPGLNSTNEWGVGSNGQDIALTPDGTRAYVASGAPYVFLVYDTQPDQRGYMTTIDTLDGEAYPNNVQISDQGLIAAASSAIYDPTDLWLYDDRGALVADHKITGYAAGILSRQVQISGDGQRLVVLSDDPRLTFLTAVP